MCRSQSNFMNISESQRKRREDITSAHENVEIWDGGKRGNDLRNEKQNEATTRKEIEICEILTEWGLHLERSNT